MGIIITIPEGMERPDYDDMFRLFGMNYSYYADNSFPDEKRWTWFVKESKMNYQFKYDSDEFLFRLIYL